VLPYVASNTFGALLRRRTYRSTDMYQRRPILPISHVLISTEEIRNHQEAFITGQR
jgi:hypothetical protein